MIENNIPSAEVSAAVKLIRTAILQSQERAVKAVNQEQLSLYYGIGRFISANTRSKNWGKGVIESISKTLQSELPGLRGFGERNLKNMRTFYEAWSSIDSNSAIEIAKTGANSAIAIAELSNSIDNQHDIILPLQLTQYPEFPLKEFLNISFTHHIRILENTKNMEERLFYIKYCDQYKPTCDDLPSIIKKQDLYHHQGQMPNNFITTLPDYKQAFRAIQMFKDEYMLDFINVEQLGMHEDEVDERVVEQSIFGAVEYISPHFE